MRAVTGRMQEQVSDERQRRAEPGRKVAREGGAAIEGEIARIRPVIASGGYIPGCDHGVPSDVSWPDYVRYVGLLARATGWI